MSGHQEHSWGPTGPEGKERCPPLQSDRRPGNAGAQALLEEAAPSVNFLEAQFAHHQSRSGRRVIRRGCLSSPESPGLASRVKGDLARQTPSAGDPGGEALGADAAPEALSTPPAFFATGPERGATQVWRFCQ